MTYARAVHRAVDWLMAVRGYIADDGGPLAAMAREFWEDWWSEWTAPSPAEGTRLVEAALKRPRPSYWHESLVEVAHDEPAWVRTADYVTTTQERFPWHHTPAEMGTYLSAWSEPTAREDMATVGWALTERPGGWAGTVTNDGNHRGMVAFASGVPIVCVRLNVVCSLRSDRGEVDPH